MHKLMYVCMRILYCINVSGYIGCMYYHLMFVGGFSAYADHSQVSDVLIDLMAETSGDRCIILFVCMYVITYCIVIKYLFKFINKD